MRIANVERNTGETSIKVILDFNYRILYWVCPMICEYIQIEGFNMKYF